MTERLPPEPRRAHTTPSPPRTSVDEHGRHQSAEGLLHEDDERIATELPEIAHHSIEQWRRDSADAQGSIHMPASYILRPESVRAQTEQERREEEELARAGFRFNRYRHVPVPRQWYHPFQSWWGSHVSLKVDVASRRDHLALERTFLGYLRTSLALSMTGVVIAQLFRLQKSRTPSTRFGYFVSAEPLAACFIASAIVVVLIGAIRFWRQQGSMVRGKIWAGGWEIYATMGLSVALCLGLLAVTVGVIVQHDVRHQRGEIW